MELIGEVGDSRHLNRLFPLSDNSAWSLCLILCPPAMQKKRRDLVAPNLDDVATGNCWFKRSTVLYFGEPGSLAKSL